MDDTSYYQQNPYDAFMRKHLEHYGYYTGRNGGYRSTYGDLEDWEKTFGYALSDNQNDSSSDSDDDENEGNVSETRMLLQTSRNLQSINIGQPRELFATHGATKQPSRWPEELEVLSERVKHLDVIPDGREPLYQPTGEERTPLIRSYGVDRHCRVVFSYTPSPKNFFMRARIGGCREGPSSTTPCAVEDTNSEDLQFESRFESGNLQKAVLVGTHEYELWLRTDLYTSKHTQWYYFRCCNTRANHTYRFTICNFMKGDSLYNQGMKPLMYSEREAQEYGKGWYRNGSNIKYYKTTVKYNTAKGEKSFYALTFTVEFNYDDDTVYFSHCYPYTYTDLQDYLHEINTCESRSKLCKQRILCRTLAGNITYLLTITSPSQAAADNKHKRGVVITSRVHPGETNGSWMMKGVLDFLLSDTADAQVLRDIFIFKIVPMLNPDGVIVGNYRCSLTGRDLNRNYKSQLKDCFPVIWNTKNMIRRFKLERDIVLYCDLHGHSRKQNVFIYGCENRYDPTRRLRERIFPAMLSKNAPDKFRFECCKFKVQKSKEGTGRIVMWNLGIMNSFTMESTFCGSTIGRLAGYHFNQRDLESMGFHLCDTLLDYCDPDQAKSAKMLGWLEEKLRHEIMLRLQRRGIEKAQEDVNLEDDFSSGIESSDGGSDSDVSDGLPAQLQFTEKSQKPLITKKKKLKSKKERDRITEASADSEKEKTVRSPFTAPSHRRPGRLPPGVYSTAAKKNAQSTQQTKQQSDTAKAEGNNNNTNVQSASSNGTGDAPSFRYSMTAEDVAPRVAGLCQQHQTYTHQLLAEHLAAAAEASAQRLINKDSAIGKLLGTEFYRVSNRPDEWKHMKPLGSKIELKERFPVKKDSPQFQYSQPSSASIGRLSSSKQSRTPINNNRHIIEVSAASQRQQDSLRKEERDAEYRSQSRTLTPSSHRCWTPASKQQQTTGYDRVRASHALEQHELTGSSLGRSRIKALKHASDRIPETPYEIIDSTVSPSTYRSGSANVTTSTRTDLGSLKVNSPSSGLPNSRPWTHNDVSTSKRNGDVLTSKRNDDVGSVKDAREIQLQRKVDRLQQDIYRETLAAKSNISGRRPSSLSPADPEHKSTTSRRSK